MSEDTDRVRQVEELCERIKGISNRLCSLGRSIDLADVREPLTAALAIAEQRGRTRTEDFSRPMQMAHDWAERAQSAEASLKAAQQQHERMWSTLLQAAGFLNLIAQSYIPLPEGPKREASELLEKIGLVLAELQAEGGDE